MLKREPFTSMSITSRSISVNDKNFNRNNGFSWKSQINRLNSEWVVTNTENLNYSHFQLTVVQRIKKRRLQHAFMLKTLPESRVEIIVGKKGQRDVQFICFIADNLYLIKFFETSNWTIIDRLGEIRSFP